MYFLAHHKAGVAPPVPPPPDYKAPNLNRAQLGVLHVCHQVGLLPVTVTVQGHSSSQTWGKQLFHQGEAAYTGRPVWPTHINSLSHNHIGDNARHVPLGPV